jgi:transcription elongation GreA/GreB family factor
MIDKKKIIETLIGNFEKEKIHIEAAAATTKRMVAEGDMKQEAKHDTRAIEASYLAGAQARRVEEIKLEIQILEEVELKDYTDKDDIAIGAIVDMDCNGNIAKYFISPTSGGTMLSIDGQAILVISVFSPIGDAALGLSSGDDFEIEIPKGTRNYDILSIS